MFIYLFSYKFSNIDFHPYTTFDCHIRQGVYVKVIAWEHAGEE